MALPRSPLGLVIPLRPDSYQCSGSYGSQLDTLDCIEAASRFPTGATAQLYSIDNTRLAGYQPYNIPSQVMRGDCLVKLDIIGDEETRGRVSIVPDVVRGLAAFVIAQCVTGAGVGGYATDGLANMIQYILSPQEYPYAAAMAPPFPANLSPFPQTALFFTVTVSDHTNLHRYPPGYDPAIPIMLVSGINDERATSNNPAYALFTEQVLLRGTITGMSPWYGDGGPQLSNAASAINDDMTYECDASLGSPSMVDCSQIEYSQLGASSDSVSLGPGAGKVFVENTCRVTVDASMAITLTWNQIKIALDTLLRLCVGNPLTKGRGGKAFYGSQSAVALEETVTGGSKRKRRRRAVTGLNALPLHVNITISAG